MKPKIVNFYTLICTTLLLLSCKSNKTDDLIVVPLDQSYNEGIELLEKHKYAKAAEKFEKVFFQHPGNEFTPYAELMQGYSLFMAGNYDEAIDVLDTFITLHPMHADIAYAYYLKALSYYMEVSNVELDQSKTKFAKDSFDEIMKKFPHSKYARDAALKIDLVNEHLAGKEMEIGLYYLKMKDPIAAIKRFQVVVENYQTTSHIAECLYRLVFCYIQLGVVDEAKRYAAVLGNNYKDSKWYQYSYDLVTKYSVAPNN